MLADNLGLSKSSTLKSLNCLKIKPIPLLTLININNGIGLIDIENL